MAVFNKINEVVHHFGFKKADFQKLYTRFKNVLK